MRSALGIRCKWARPGDAVSRRGARRMAHGQANLAPAALVLWAALGGILCGCTNAPGALALELSAEAGEVRPDECMHLHARLVARKGPVCLTRMHRLVIEMERLYDQPLTIREEPTWICGTRFMSTICWYPVLLAATLLDVGDSLGRFEVMDRGRNRAYDLYVWCRQSESGELRLAVSDQVPHDAERAPWPTGRYQVRATLDNRDAGFYPAPLFWYPYDQPVSAEAELKIGP